MAINGCSRTRNRRQATQRSQKRSTTRFSVRTATQLSCARGPETPLLSNETLASFYEKELLTRFSTRPALASRHERSRNSEYLRWTYEELWKEANDLARGLLGLGLTKGTRVGVVMGNNSAYAQLQWACSIIGAILVTVNPAYKVHELMRTLNHVGVSHLFLVPNIRTSRYLSLLAEACPEIANSARGDIQAEALPHLKRIIVVDNTQDAQVLQKELDGCKSAIDFREILIRDQSSWEERKRKVLQESLDSHDVINLQFTSGTTGYPKAVSLTHHNLLNNALSIGDCMRLTEQDVLCNVPPLFHCFDNSCSLSACPRLVLGNLAAFTHGSCVVYPSETFDPKRVVDALLEEKCTALHGVPTHFLGVLSEVERRKNGGDDVNLSRLRTGIAAGSPIPIDLMKQLIEKMNLTELTVAYGMSDPVSFQTTTADPIAKRVETVGKILPHVTAKIVDMNGAVVARGMPGEILVKGYLVQKGYWQDEEQTKAVTRVDEEDGQVWMCTGDEAVMDEEGYVKIVGRVKDIIIRGGENLFPVCIENVLTDSPAIREAAVVSVPDTKFGEVVGAWVVLEEAHRGKIQKEDVRKVVSTGMNSQNAPAYVWFFGDPRVEELVEESKGGLPKTASGKVQKHILRAWSKELASTGYGKVAS
ncbi:acetyl-CoA synthetase-like protein [Thelephora terrestris]|uniref:Acetyl-CoA synthetase-like protein n=1 Tax=Thelephora terrestris TaxID=56493 RepID=A0A9P6H4X1_9AGAM|nr:acetyl-CoA synthetase-like protein [Thelephora terrestris]